MRRNNEEMEEKILADRYDGKKRKLQTGEYWDEKTGRYKYRYKDNGGKWCTVYSWTLTHNDRIPTGKNQKSGESLREKEAQVQKDLLEDINSSKGNMSLYDLMDLYIQTRWKDVKQTTRAGYTTQLNFMREEDFGKRKIGTITESEALLWFDELHEKKGKNYSTLQTLRGILRPAFTLAKKNHWVRDNPFDFVMLKKRYGGTRTREALSREDMRRFLDFVRFDKHFRIYFPGMYILFNTGLRISEFCGLTLDDLDFKNHTIRVNKQLLRGMVNGKNTYYIEDTAKTDSGERFVPMSDDVEACFRDVISKRPSFDKEPEVCTEDGKMVVSGFLFFDKNNNLEVAQHWENHFRWALQKFNRIYKDELCDVTPHVARHTFCSNMATSGMTPKTLQYIMGHSDIAITLNVYTHVQSGDTTEEYRRIVSSMNTKQYTMYSLDREPNTYVPQVDSIEDLEEENE